MLLAFKLVSGLVALFHLGFLYLEMFLWATPTGMKIFKMSASQAEATKVLAMNQGLYNGFLAAGIGYGLLTGDLRMITVFLIFVLIAGVYGALTASPTILFLQALPALIALLLRYFV